MTLRRVKSWVQIYSFHRIIVVNLAGRVQVSLGTISISISAKSPVRLERFIRKWQPFASTRSRARVVLPVHPRQQRLFFLPFVLPLEPLRR
uniref:Uncharacterized protein n=1 Tax=Aquilaria malaccensis TaxID=223753 RepID=A0A4Y6GLJ9_9ROSI|nr:hypothetical protein [Aquilaria malaccensis]